MGAPSRTDWMNTAIVSQYRANAPASMLVAPVATTFSRSAAHTALPASLIQSGWIGMSRSTAAMVVVLPSTHCLKVPANFLR